MPLNAFTDQAATQGLYSQRGREGRLGRRTAALHRAKVAGSDVTQAITATVGQKARLRPGSVIADIGCGRGSVTLALARHFPRCRVIAIDASAAMLADTGQKVTAHGHRAAFALADFHALPFTGAGLDAAVAAFCLYHSPRPADVISEIARTLTPGGLAVLVTKSADSYHELDEILASAGIDPTAASRPSLYASAHSGNLTALAGAHLDVIQTRHEQHRFRFRDFTHLARYVTTSPRYQLPGSLQTPGRLAAELRRIIPEQAVLASSTVTFVCGLRR